RFAARSVRASIDELAESLPQGCHRNTPDFRPAHDRGFFSRGQFQPETGDQLLAIGVRGPSDRQRGKVLRGVGTAVRAGFHDYVCQTIKSRTYPRRGQRTTRKLRAQEFQNDVLRETQQVRKRLLAIARSIL